MCLNGDELEIKRRNALVERHGWRGKKITPQANQPEKIITYPDLQQPSSKGHYDQLVLDSE